MKQTCMKRTGQLIRGATKQIKTKLIQNGADDYIMPIVNERDKSPETAELVRKRVELA